MTGALRIAAVVAATLALGACNAVVTQAPMFTSADAGGGVLKPGVWEFAPPCRPDQAAQNACEAPTPFIVTPADLRRTGETDPALAEPPMPYLVTAGDPRIVQIEAQSPEPGAKADLFYVYAALNPTASDPDGRITAAEAWPIMCGPPPKSGEGSGSGHDGTTQPAPGMTMSDGGQCTPADKAAIVGAVASSRDWSGGPVIVRWTRDAP